jgi:succinate dehydrogenase hydrophobic anchor subunit
MLKQENIALYGASTPKTGENFWLWFLKIVSGVLVVVVLFTHLIIQHLVGSSGLLTHHEIVNFFANPFYRILEGSFLVAVVTHALIGLRSVFLDLNPSQKILKAADRVMIAVWIISIVYGIWLIQRIVSFAGAA